MTGQRLRARSRAVQLLAQWWMTLLLPLSGLLILVARQDAWRTERIYSARIYPVIARLLGGFTSLFAFSLFEAAICGGIFWAVVWLFLGVRRRMRGGRFFRAGWPSTVRRFVNLVSLLIFMFVLTCGLNYYRPEFTAFSGLEVRGSSVHELAELGVHLANKANLLRESIPEDANGVSQMEPFDELARQAKNAFDNLSQEYDVLPVLPVSPKPVMNSWWMSMTQITGIFTGHTCEANINVAAPAYTIPATMCHELAHTRGFMREDEANFLAYLACEKSEDNALRYSGVMLALVHTLNRLYAADRWAYAEVSHLLSDGVRADFDYNNRYWAQYEGPVAEVSTAVNNTYLKVNNQTDGVKSYGRMVDLLLADYRARFMHEMSQAV